MEPFFEEFPWLLVPLVIIIVEVWNALKRLVVRSRKAATAEQKSLS